MSCKFNNRLFLFAAVLCLGVLQIFASYLLSAEKQLSTKRVNYKLLSNLQEIKDPSPARALRFLILKEERSALRIFVGSFLCSISGPAGASLVARRCRLWSASTRNTETMAS